MQLTVLFVVGNVTWEVRVSLDPGTTVEAGDHVEVAYDPSDPSNLVVVGQPSNRNDALAIFVWLTTPLVAMRFGWSAWREMHGRVPVSGRRHPGAGETPTD